MRRMRGARFFVAWLVMLLGACQADGRTSAQSGPPEQGAAARETADTTPGRRLPELTQSLEPLRSAFNAGKGESRFIALLSPT
jgi:hypothetical protein